MCPWGGQGSHGSQHLAYDLEVSYWDLQFESFPNLKWSPEARSLHREDLSRGVEQVPQTPSSVFFLVHCLELCHLSYLELGLGHLCVLPSIPEHSASMERSGTAWDNHGRVGRGDRCSRSQSPECEVETDTVASETSTPLRKTEGKARTGGLGDGLLGGTCFSRIKGPGKSWGPSSCSAWPRSCMAGSLRP